MLGGIEWKEHWVESHHEVSILAVYLVALYLRMHVLPVRNPMNTLSEQY